MQKSQLRLFDYFNGNHIYTQLYSPNIDSEHTTINVKLSTNINTGLHYVTELFVVCHLQKKFTIQ